MKIEILKSDWIGIGLGALIGLYQGIVVFDSEIGRGLDNAEIWPVILFGLFGPPILALLNKYLPLPMPGFYKAIGKYVNTIFLMVAFGICTGISGFTYYWVVGGPDSVLFLLSFFSSAGGGFFLAYLIYPELAFRPESNA
ncbi:hypothetical protein [Lacimicrobium alkaliphilum]|uniref:Uncharacterized protein n=1 Tax=Lacimicrobium alkaliphilum TaxID=1526571 RepID=A0ABQ1R4L8_9ALTE|nr:hypothetical protein [Lacimicrobium alkaliphilum]GGD53810.1 hypothetical protein GCM10011357_06980 [Lacimicrobium alkaliphilum]